MPARVAEAVARSLLHENANVGGTFATSREAESSLEAAHRAAADLFGASDPHECVFGPNMTSLTFALSRALGRRWRAGDEIVVTRLDHDANVSPWILAARDAGATVRHVGIREDCTLDLDELSAAVNSRTRLVAAACASNAVGTIHPVETIAAIARNAGALVFLDAVHYAPHGLLDVAAWDADFVAASAYKFFGPHVGILWGRRPLLDELPAYKVRPAPSAPPGKWMTGTQSHEGIAGTLEAIDYLADIGRDIERELTGEETRRAALETAYRAIGEYERSLVARLLDGLAEIPGVKVWGITDRGRLTERVPTLGITHARLSPRRLSEHLAERGIFVWDGNFYALPLTEALGLEPEGMVRIGLLHYNTIEEVERLLGELESLA